MVIPLLVVLLAQAASPSAPLSGRVLDVATGAPIANARVELYRIARIIPSGTTDSDDGGNYAFPDLKPGVYSTVCRAQGYLDVGRKEAIILRNPTAHLHRDCIMARPATLSGIVRDVNGSVVPGALVQILRGTDRPRLLYTLFAGSSGTFKFSSLSPGTYIVRAVPKSARTDEYGLPLDTHAVYAPSAVQPEDARHIDLAAGATVDDADITLPPPVVTHRLDGRVLLGATDQPMHGLISAIHNERLTQFGAHSQLAEDGSFHMDDLPAGRYRVYLQLPARNGGNLRFRWIDFDMPDEDISGALFRAWPGVSLRGNVRCESHSCADLAVVLVNKISGRNFVIRVADTGGSFEIPGIPPGDYTLTMPSAGKVQIRSALMNNKEIVRDGFRVEQDDTTLPPVDVMVVSGQHGYSLHGRVVDETGHPVAGITVMLLGPRFKGIPEPVVLIDVSDLDGTFVISQPRPCECLVVALPHGDFSVQDPDSLEQLLSVATPVKIPETNWIELKPTNFAPADKAEAPVK